MGFTLTGTVLGKEDFFSKKKNEQVYQLNMYDGARSIISVLNVSQDVYGAVTIGEVISIKCYVRPYAQDGQARLLVSYKELLNNG